MRKSSILFIVSIILCLFYSGSVYSQTECLTAGEKSGKVIDSIITASSVTVVQVEHPYLKESSYYSETAIKSDNFKISGHFLILKGSSYSTQEIDYYYNLEKLLDFYVHKNKLYIYIER